MAENKDYVSSRAIKRRMDKNQAKRRHWHKLTGIFKRRFKKLARKFRRKRRREQRARAGPAKAVKWAKAQVGTTESPPGSNRGAKVDEWTRYTGYDPPIYWCGCFVCVAVVREGKASIPVRIRLGYDGHIKADAAAGANGLKRVPVSAARPGDIVTYTFPHIELVRERQSGSTIKTVGGNTSPQSGSGSQNNGGGVYLRERPIGQVACVARPDY